MESISKFCLLIIALAAIFASANAADELPAITDVCLGCICEAISNCNITQVCRGNTCGLFRITQAYWIDSGRPTHNGQSSDAENAFSNCVIEPECAARTVKSYMANFGQDCNGDNVINCYDHMAIHKNGGYSCKRVMPQDYVNRFNACVSAAQSLLGIIV